MKAHSRATKLAATFLARLSSADVAAATFRVDVQTVRRWQAGGDVPEDTWTAVRDVLLTRGAEMAAKGDVKGLVQTLTAAGISERNVRYGELLRQREARRTADQATEEPEPVDPWRVAIHELSDSRQRLLRDVLDLQLQDLEREDPPARTQEESNTAFLEFIEKLAAMPDDEVEAESQRVRAQLDAMFETQMAEAQRSRTAQRPAEPVPAAPETPPAPPEAPKLRAVDDAGYPDQWTPYRRFDL